MTRSRKNLRIPLGILIPVGSNGPILPSPNSNADHQRAMFVIGLGILIKMLRSRQLYTRAATVAIVLAALAGLAGLDKESRAKALARIKTWITMEDERLKGAAKIR
jgi:hypothetical protein